METITTLPVDKAEVIRKLTRLHNRATLYELVVKNHTSCFFLSYTWGRTRALLLKVARKNGAALSALTGSDSLDFAKKTADGGTMEDWALVWTGRTEREAICQGEYPRLPK